MTIRLNGEPHDARRSRLHQRAARRARHRSATRRRRTQSRGRAARRLRLDGRQRRRRGRDRQLRRRRLIAALGHRMHSDPLVIAGRTFRSRLIVGTGKYPSHTIMADAHRASGADMVTVAVRRVNLTDRSTESLLDYIDTSKIFILPNTAGCYTAEDAIRTARLGREVGLSNWVKLEVIGDEQTLFPDNVALLEATRVLVARRLRRAAVHQRRSGRLPQARRSGRGGRHAARRADRVGPRHPEPEQHPDHQGAGARAGDRRRRRRHGVRRGDRDGARRRRRADEHGDRAGPGSGGDGARDEAGGRGRTPGVPAPAGSRGASSPPPAARRRGSSDLRRPRPDDRAARRNAPAPRAGARRGGPPLQRGADRARSRAAPPARAPRSAAGSRRASARPAQRGLEHPAGAAGRLGLAGADRRSRVEDRRAVPAAAADVQLAARRSRQPHGGRAAGGAPAAGRGRRRRCAAISRRSAVLHAPADALPPADHRATSTRATATPSAAPSC